MTKILLNEKTIILTIGITNCGKSYFCDNKLIPFLKSKNATVKYLSSDKIRRELVDDNTLHKHANRGLQVSSQAFSILENQLDNYTQYPVNTDVVIVDAMNINKEGREFIFKIAAKNNYRIVGLLFDYKEKDEYFKYTQDENLNKKLIHEKLKYFRENTLKEIKRTDFTNLYTITSTNFDDCVLEYKDLKIQPNLDAYKQFAVIGDIHGCFDEFIEALTDNKGIAYDPNTGKLSISDVDNYHHHILVGDLVDKGTKTKEVIKFVYNNMEFFSIVRGNHENFVYKFLKGELGSYEKNEELIKSWFDTIDLIKDDEEYLKMFNHIFENSYDFIETGEFIVTHAPCDVKYLGKTDAKSIKSQRNFTYPKRTDFETDEAHIEAKEKSFAFLLDQAQFIHPMHFFGHVNIKDTFKHKNKFNLDTGCVSGNKLTVAIFRKGQNKPFFKSYASKHPAKENLHLMFTVKKKDYDFAVLDYEEKKRIEWAAKNKLNFISGTMSPADKDMAENDLESLNKGIQYYVDAGVNRVILQPKFMGSRGNLLLHKSDVEKCQLFSRQGYLIDNKRLQLEGYDLLELFKTLQAKYISLFDNNFAEYILFDGELLPWSVMGKKLIDKDFVIPYIGAKTELDVIKENGFFEMIEKLENKINTTSDQDLMPHELNIKKAYYSIKNEIQDEKQMRDDVESYITQLNYFTSETPLEYKPFAILKIIKIDGSEVNCISEKHSNIDMFKNLSDEKYLILDFENLECKTWIGYETTINVDNIQELFRLAGLYWDEITEQNHMEGVVIKPEFTYKNGVAPFIKCRNKGYLKLVYGMDYNSLEHKKDELIKKKSIKNKMATSIKEWALGKKLLDIKRSDISIDNKEWVSLVYQLMNEQEAEKTLDPRL